MVLIFPVFPGTRFVEGVGFEFEPQFSIKSKVGIEVLKWVHDREPHFVGSTIKATIYNFYSGFAALNRGGQRLFQPRSQGVLNRQGNRSVLWTDDCSRS